MKIYLTVFIFILNLTFLPKAYAQSSSGSGGMALATGLVTSGMGVVSGHMLVSSCHSTEPPTMPLCAMGYLSYGQAGLSLMSATSGGTAKSAYSANKGTFSVKDLDPGLRNDLAGLGIKTETDMDNYIKNQQNLLKKKGFDLNADGTVKTPKGNFSPGVFSSAAAMADAGLIDPSQVDAVQKKIDAIGGKFKNITLNSSIGGGGGGGGSGTSKYTYDDPYKNLYGNLNGEKPDAGRTEGLTRVLSSGEVVGAQTDNIFDMVRRNYREKDEAGEFDLSANRAH